MTPLQKIAMGFVIVIVDASFGEYDAVPDPVGWAMVIWGLLALRPHLRESTGLLTLAAVSLAVSVATYPSAVSGRLDASGGWALSLPQLAFCYATCTTLAPLAGRLTGRFTVLRWVFVALAVGPVLVFGAGVDALRNPLALGIWGANIYFAYLLFLASGQVPAREPVDPETPGA